MKKLSKSQIKKSVRHEMAYYTPQRILKWYAGRDTSVPTIGYIASVCVDYSDDGTCEGITIYAYGDAVSKHHAYGENVIDCKQFVEEYMRFNGDYSRDDMISDIADAIIAEVSKKSLD